MDFKAAIRHIETFIAQMTNQLEEESNNKKQKKHYKCLYSPQVFWNSKYTLENSIETIKDATTAKLIEIQELTNKINMLEHQNKCLKNRCAAFRNVFLCRHCGYECENRKAKFIFEKEAQNENR